MIYEITVIDSTGDTKAIWDPNSVSETDAARKLFNDMKAKGYSGYRVDPSTGRPMEVVKDFDPRMGSVIMRPIYVGG